MYVIKITQLMIFIIASQPKEVYRWIFKNDYSNRIKLACTCFITPDTVSLEQSRSLLEHLKVINFHVNLSKSLYSAAKLSLSKAPNVI